MNGAQADAEAYFDSLLVFDELHVGPPRVEKDRCTVPYRLTVDGNNQLDTGNYALSLYLMDLSVLPIAYGQTIEAAISPVGDVDYYTFTGEAGQHISVLLDNQAYPRWISLRLSLPDGTSWHYCDFRSADCFFDDVTLPEEIASE